MPYFWKYRCLKHFSAWKNKRHHLKDAIYFPNTQRCQHNFQQELLFSLSLVDTKFDLVILILFQSYLRFCLTYSFSFDWDICSILTKYNITYLFTFWSQLFESYDGISHRLLQIRCRSNLKPQAPLLRRKRNNKSLAHCDVSGENYYHM